MQRKFQHKSVPRDIPGWQEHALLKGVSAHTGRNGQVVRIHHSIASAQADAQFAQRGRYKAFLGHASVNMCVCVYACVERQMNMNYILRKHNVNRPLVPTDVSKTN